MPEIPRRRQADQASGLRRLFGARTAQIVAFVSTHDSLRRGADGMPLILKTAANLIQSEMGVVVMDEHAAAASVFASFGLKVRKDLLDVVDARHTASEIVVEGPSGLRLVGASRFAVEMSYIDAVAEQRLDSALIELQDGSDFLMLDCAARASGEVSPLAIKAHHVTVMVTPQATAITQAYVQIKHLARMRHGQGIHVLVNRARNEKEARSVFEKIQMTAFKHLGIQLDFLGCAEALDGDGMGELMRRHAQPALASGKPGRPVARPNPEPPPALARLLSVV